MSSLPTGRLKKRLRKQLFLFGLSVLLPALVLLFFIVRMNRQDYELRKRRVVETQQQKAEEIGRALADKLEKTERELLLEWTEDSTQKEETYKKRSDLVFAGHIVANKLQLPWKDSEGKKKLIEAGRSGELLLQAQKAEFETNNLKLASSLLRQALASASSAIQASYIKQILGRILTKMGDEEELRSLYRDMLELSSELTDDFGIPFALYAAERLYQLSSDEELILARIETIMDSNRWLPSMALFLIQDINEQIGEGTQDSVLLGKLEKLRQSLENAFENLNRLKSLEVYVSGWILRQPSRELDGAHLVWESHSDIPWIIGIRGVSEDQSMALFAFHGPRVLKTVIAETNLADTFPGVCRMIVGPNGKGILAGEAFVGFRLLFEETEVSAWSKSFLPFPILYWLILFLVFGFTAFGTFLLWRDVSRELAIAEMRSQFAASVSHELKTPLTSIRMFAEALTMGVKERPEEQKDYLETIICESERLSRLLNNVLDFSKIEQGTRTYRFEPTSLEDVSFAAEKTMAFPLNQKGFCLQIEVESGIPMVLADRDALEQAILNLLHNAMKYSGESREIFLKLRREGDKAKIDVIDFGVGISEEDRRLIFGKFFRVTGIENQRIPGTGLGLTIVSHIAQAHGGRIEVESRPGEGSTFSIVLPLEAK